MKVEHGEIADGTLRLAALRCQHDVLRTVAKACQPELGIGPALEHHAERLATVGAGGVDDEDEDTRARNVAQKVYAQTDALAGAVDDAGDVRDADGRVVVVGDDAD